jgi:uncharacterized membrane protein
MQQVIFFTALALSCLTAWFRGGTPERLGALLLATAAVVSTLVADSGSYPFAEFEWGLFAIDSILFLTLVWLALSADRYWPMWLAALQLVSVWVHPAFAFSQSKIAFAYAVTSIFWSYPMLMILAIGAVRHHKRTHFIG